VTKAPDSFDNNKEGYMKKLIGLLCIGSLVFVSCVKGEHTDTQKKVEQNKKEKDLIKTVRFIDEKNLELKEAYTMLIKYYSFSDDEGQTYELSYKGYIDNQGVIRKIISYDKDFEYQKEFNEEYMIRKTKDGYYFEYASIWDGVKNCISKHHIIIEKDGFIDKTQQVFITPESISLNGEQVNTISKIKYLNTDNYIWQSEYQRAKIEGNKYIEEEYNKAEFRRDNTIFENNTVIAYDDLKQDGSPEIKCVYPFTYKKDLENQEVVAILHGYQWGMEALFDTPGWKDVRLDIEIHVKTNLHSEDMKTNILNQYLIPSSDYLIPFIYYIPITYK